MPPKTSLRALLRKDIVRGRVSIAPFRGRPCPSSSRNSKTAPEELHVEHLFDSPPEGKDSIIESETGSLFGEPIVKEKTREEKRQEKLQRLLAEDTQVTSQAQTIRCIESEALKEMRKELENLVTRDVEASFEEKLDIRKEKRSLIRRIAVLEAEERGKKAKELKCRGLPENIELFCSDYIDTATFDDISKTLPAIGPDEAKKLNTKAEKISKAISGPEVILILLNTFAVWIFTVSPEKTPEAQSTDH